MCNGHSGSKSLWLGKALSQRAGLKGELASKHSILHLCLHILIFLPGSLVFTIIVFEEGRDKRLIATR